MKESEFNELITEFVKKYRNDGWELSDEGMQMYGVNSRKQIPCIFDNFTVFANYYISLDQVFSTPVLSATFYNEVGHRLTYDELLKIIPEKLDLGSISEREDENVGEPVFFIHPCKTEEFIKPFLLDDNNKNYLHIFMIRYGPIFFYKLPF